MFKLFNKKSVLSIKSRTSGLTFVEIIIAGLLMVVVFIIGWTISNSFVGVRKVRNYETAVYLANQAIEAVRAARSVELGKDGELAQNTLLADFSSSEDMYDKFDGFKPEIKVGNVVYKRRISIINCPSKNKNLDPDLKLIRVVISWKSPSSSKPVEFEVVTAHCGQY